MTGPEVVDTPPALRTASWLGCPAFGAGLLWLLKLAAEWAATVPWLPGQGAFRLVDSIPEPLATIAALALGGLAGLVLAFYLEHEGLRLTVGSEWVSLRRAGEDERFARASVSAVFFDGNKVVLLGEDGGELAREPWELSKKRVRQAFEKQGYPWREQDPFGAEFQLWVDDTPELSRRANTLLRAREEAIAKDRAAKAREIRRELGKVGVFVREEKKLQYWRMIGQD